jgi:hypothetical protein
MKQKNNLSEILLMSALAIILSLFIYAAFSAAYVKGRTDARIETHKR